MTEGQPEHFIRRWARWLINKTGYVLLVAFSLVIALGALLVPLLDQMWSPVLQAGQVAPEEFRAPRTLTYTSEILTEQRRQTAANAVAPIYTTPDSSVARQQRERLRASLDYIANVRADEFATPEQKEQDLAQLEYIRLKPPLTRSLLELTDARWQVVQQETTNVLEKMMTSVVRQDNLPEVRSNAPNLVNLAISEDLARLIADLAAPFVTPNSQYSEEATQAARQKASEGVIPLSRTYVMNQTIVLRGQVISEADLEALQQYGLAQSQQKWQDLVSAALLVGLMLAFMVTYLRRERRNTAHLRRLLLITLLFLLYLVAARLVIPSHTVIPYAFPLAAYGLTVSVIFGVQTAMITSLPLAILAAYNLPNALDLTIYYIIGSLLSILALGRARRMASFVWAGTAVALSGVAAVVVYRLPLPATDMVGLMTLAGAALFNGIVSASLAVLLVSVFGQVLSIITPMQLLDLSRPDHPLLKLILHDAPGTYQHSLQLANLSEQAAELIGADAFLTRVGALYHDAGKATNPLFFIENQVPGFINPHEDLEPADSAGVIICHVVEGLELARKYHLPARIWDFIAEHHGTLLTRYQYVRAVQAAGGDESSVDQNKFRYPGPRPRSRETAILMLADGCEAIVRAEHPKGEDELRKLIKTVIDDRVASGQLDDTRLTLRDLDTIRESFVATLRGVFHPRVNYPRLEQTAASTEVKTRPVTYPVPPSEDEAAANEIELTPADQPTPAS